MSATGGDATMAHVVSRVLVVRVGAEQVALPLQAVRELVDAPVITPVPLAPTALRRHCALRGQHLPVLDLGALLGIAREPAEVAIALVADDGSFALGVDDALD
ncbi:MAG TPA: chemotaxis protein CheW, partial [Gemmatimonadaceae bacterium]|nr:chemotaxis protein CheW [Gemmatimonadaceae bacterium]